MDFRVDPYDTEADPALWAVAYRWAARAVEAGLGITVHAAEFSVANLVAALRVPGLRRLGHAVYAAAEPHLLEAGRKAVPPSSAAPPVTSSAARCRRMPHTRSGSSWSTASP